MKIMPTEELENIFKWLALEMRARKLVGASMFWLIRPDYHLLTAFFCQI